MMVWVNIRGRWHRVANGSVPVVVGRHGEGHGGRWWKQFSAYAGSRKVFLLVICWLIPEIVG